MPILKIIKKWETIAISLADIEEQHTYIVILYMQCIMKFQLCFRMIQLMTVNL